jgi:beta-lactamase class A
MHRKISRYMVYFILSSLLVGVGWYAHDWYQRRVDTAAHRRVHLPGYRFISPLLDVELPEGYGIRHEPIPFKYKIKEFVDSQLKTGRVRDITVYFRDLSDGPWFGINEGVTYNPASLMKVPVMIAWLKRAEKDPEELERTIAFREKDYPGVPQTIEPARTLTDGAAYPVETLLHYMLNFSDNKSMWLLYNNLKPAELDNVLNSMDVDNDARGETNAITAHGYSGFFRILYNAAYLNRAMSEKALELMSHQNFPMGIEAGLPKGVVFSGKFGEYDLKGSGNVKQLHEFGIVYHPKGPYILGILTRGDDPALQLEIIRKISSMTYMLIDANVSGSPKR